MKVIKYKKEYKGKKYNIYVEKQQDVFISVYLGDYLFFNSLKDKKPLKYFLMCEKKPTKNDLENKLPYLKVRKIEELNKEDLFKNEIEVI